MFFLRFSEVFAECFLVISGFSIPIHIRIHYHFSTRFPNVGLRPPYCGEPFSHCPPWLKPILAQGQLETNQRALAFREVFHHHIAAPVSLSKMFF